MNEKLQMSATEKILESCDNCGACVRSCMFLSHYCDSPRELAKRFMRNPMENIDIPFSCFLCGLCERVCHLKLSPGDMFLEIRQKYFRNEEGRLLPNDFVYDYVIPRLKGMRNTQAVSTSGLFTFGKKPSDNGSSIRRVFFPGCSLPSYSPRLVMKTYEYLRQQMPGTGIVLNCCGKPSHDAGDNERFNRIFDKTIQQFKDLGVQEVVLACINCHKVFREHSGIKLKTVYEIFAENGLPEGHSSGTGLVSVHDSCPARYQPEIRQAVREVVSRMGYEIHEMKFRNEMTQCCGAGGCATVGNPSLAFRHTQAREAKAKGRLITYCAHCRERFSSFTPSLHLLDLVFGASQSGHLKEYNDSWLNWLDRWYLKKQLRFKALG